MRLGENNFFRHLSRVFSHFFFVFVLLNNFTAILPHFVSFNFRYETHIILHGDGGLGLTSLFDYWGGNSEAVPSFIRRIELKGRWVINVDYDLALAIHC